MNRARSKQLMFEDYLSFVEDPDPRALTMDQLNKILSIHACCRLKTKGEVVSGLNALVVMNPRRSTLGDRAAVYPCAPLDLEVVKDDIRSMEWDECPIGSILAVGSAVEAAAPAPAEKKDLDRPISAAAEASSVVPRKKRQRGIKRKRRAKAAADALTALVPV